MNITNKTVEIRIGNYKKIIYILTHIHLQTINLKFYPRCVFIYKRSKILFEKIVLTLHNYTLTILSVIAQFYRIFRYSMRKKSYVRSSVSSVDLVLSLTSCKKRGMNGNLFVQA